MKSQSDEKETPSRETDPQTVLADGNRNEHDTPPPLLIGNGSVVVETASDFDLVQDSGNDKKHHIRAKGAGKQKIFVAHIKVVDGSGEMLYRYDIDHTNTSNNRYKLEITAALTNGARLTLNSSSLVDARRDLVLTTGPDRKVAPKCPPAHPNCLDKPQHGPSGVRGFRHRLARVSNPIFLDNDSIEHITITRDAGDFLFILDVARHRAGKELRIMIWPGEEA